MPKVLRPFFSKLLVDDAENAAEVDHLAGNLGAAHASFPVDDGYVSGIIQDESG